MGMTAGQVLRRVELPLAMPLIFAGLRTASVYVVATATLATFAGGGGLGDIIVNEASGRWVDKRTQQRAAHAVEHHLTQQAVTA